MTLQGIMLSYFSKKGDKERDDKIPFPTGVTCFTDISYGPYGKENLLDVYLPEGTDHTVPTIVSIHGGGFVYSNKENYKRYCMDLARRGFAVVNFNYRLAPKSKFPAPLDDTNAVMEWICANAEKYHLDPTHMIVVGDSAGAQLASHYGAIFSNPEFASHFAFKVPAIRICALALNCGMYNMSKDAAEARKGIFLDYLGRRIAKDDPRLKVLESVTSNYPPSYVMTSANDFLKEHAEPMYKFLIEKGVPAQWKCYGVEEQKHIAHVFHLNIILPEAVECNDVECDFFKQYL